MRGGDITQGGKLRAISATTASAGAGATVVNLRPSAGHAWLVCFCNGSQDDGAVQIAWQYTDPAGTVEVSVMTAPGANAWTGLGASDQINQGYAIGPIWCTYNRYLSFRFTASAGAKNGYVRAIVIEYEGMEASA